LERSWGIYGVKSISMRYNGLAFIKISEDFKNVIKDIFKEVLI